MLKINKKDLWILLVFGLVLFFPVNPLMPTATADGAWVLVLNHAITQHWLFGQDLIFTYGFFAYLGTLAYDPVLFPYLMMFWFFFLVSIIVYLDALIEGQQNHWVKILSALICLACVLSYGPGVFYPVYILVFGLYALKQEKTVSFWNLLGSALLGIITLIKFSYGFLALILILMLTLFDVKQKRFPLKLLCYGVAVLLSFVVNHQPLAMLSDFISGVMQISSGYNDSMGLGGTRFFPIIVYIAMAIYLCRFLSAIQYYQSKSLNRGAVFLLALSFFIMFKASFIRADAHIFYAFVYELSVIFLLLTLHLSTYAGSFKSVLSQKKVIFLIVVALVFMAVAKDNIIPNPIQNAKNVLNYPYLAKVYQSDLQDIRGQYPLPSVTGSADIYSFDQTILLANNINYNPRPIFQSYSAYTPKLLEMNKDHLLSRKAPANIFFSVQPIDNRYPSMEDGLSWPVLLSHYALKQSLKNYLWLTKQAQHKELHMVTVSQDQYKVGMVINVPAELHHQYVWLRITFSKNISSRLVSALFKPVQTYLTVTLMDGRTIQYRFIEGMGEAGFLFSPLVENTTQFANLYTTDGRNVLLKTNQVKSFMITYHGWQGVFTPKEYQVEFAKLDCK